MPENFHPITAKQFCLLNSTERINSIERQKILKNVYGKTVVWKIFVVDFIRKNDRSIIDGRIGNQWRSERMMPVTIQKPLKHKEYDIKPTSYVFVVGTLMKNSTDVEIINAEILSIKNKIFYNNF